jgi:hypothetical protein
MRAHTWSVRHYIAIEDHHKIIDEDDLSEPCDIDHIVSEFQDTLFYIRNTYLPGVHPETPARGQLLKPEEALEIKRGIDPITLAFLVDPTRDVIRLDEPLHISLPEDNEGMIASYFQVHKILIYWHWVELNLDPRPVVGPMIPLQVTLLTCKAESYSQVIDIPGGSTYGDFLQCLGNLFIESRSPFWGDLAELSTFLQFLYWRGMFRIYLVPLALGQEHLTLLAAIATSNMVQIDQVLFEIMWYDWFNVMPIRDLLEDSPYGLLVMPFNGGAWSDDAQEQRFMDILETMAIVAQPDTFIPMTVVPMYMALEFLERMHEFENRNGMFDWIARHCGLLKPRKPIYKENCDQHLNDAQHLLVRAQARAIIEIASSCRT